MAQSLKKLGFLSGTRICYGLKSGSVPSIIQKKYYCRRKYKFHRSTTNLVNMASGRGSEK